MTTQPVRPGTPGADRAALRAGRTTRRSPGSARTGRGGRGTAVRRRTALAAGSARSGPPPGRAPRELLTWVRVQSQNSERHVDALRPFTRDEFGAGPQVATEGHIRAANELVSLLVRRLSQRTLRLDQAVRTAT